MAAKKKVTYKKDQGEYVDTRVARGFPMGGIGAGGFSFGSDGDFAEFRLNNNWMNPVRKVAGSFFAVHVEKDGRHFARALRRSGPEPEYQPLQRIKSTVFKGELPGFDLRFEDDELPISVSISGMSPHIPHNIKDSTLPAALFTVRLENPGPEAVSASVMLSMENLLGRGGTGHTGLKKIGKVPYGVRGRLSYNDVTGNYQEEIEIAGRKAIAFKTTQSPDPRSHRMSVIGEYRLAVEAPEGFEVSRSAGWNAKDPAPPLLAEFARTGRLHPPTSPAVGSAQCRPAAAIAARGRLLPGEAKQIVFMFLWWTPNHVTEKEPVRKARSGKHDGVRVGHVYENFFSGPDQAAAYLLDERERLLRESFELAGLLSESSLPQWLKRAINNSIDSMICNTVVTADGALYTLEGMDWGWFYGGLTGTNDQRLSAHPYSSVFFTELDKREVDAFRRLMDQRGAVPHGNGNCDLALGDADVPYGWPDKVIVVLPAKEWTDLAMSEIIQAAKLYRMTGDRPFIDRFWPDLKKMADYLHSIAKNGVPEGGTTYDVWDFPGTFSYTATVYLAAMAAMSNLAAELEPAAEAVFRRRFQACKNRIDSALWVPEPGYFRSTPRRSTVFTAALAGDWAARYSGLGPVVEPDRARSHLRLQYRALIEAAKTKAAQKKKRPKPWSEAAPDGTEKKNLLGLFLGGVHMVYIWQVLSYQAMEHIYLGQVQQGLDTMEMIYDLIYGRGYAWSAGLQGGRDSVYMTHPVIWAAFNALTGAALDAPRQTLALAPRPLPGQTASKVPFFFPGAWCMLSYEGNRAEIEVRKHFGKPLAIARLRLLGPDGEVSDLELAEPLVLEAGKRFGFNLNNPE